MKESDIEQLELQRLKNSADQPIPKWLTIAVIIMLLIAIGIAAYYYLAFKEERDNRELRQNTKQIQVHKSEAEKAKANHDTVDNQTGSEIHKLAKKAAKRIEEVSKEKEPIKPIGDLDENSRKLLNYKLKNE